MIEYYDPTKPPALGSWFSETMNRVTGWVAGKGNVPGDKNSRRGIGPSESDISAQVAQILAQQSQAGVPLVSTPTAVDASQLNKILLIGGAGVVLYLLTSRK